VVVVVVVAFSTTVRSAVCVLKYPVTTAPLVNVASTLAPMHDTVNSRNAARCVARSMSVRLDTYASSTAAHVAPTALLPLQ
jgi:hypothetical protein